MWVKTDAPCAVEVRPAEPVPGCSCEAQRTFEVEGHHFALVHVTGLPDDRRHALRGAPRRRSASGLRRPGSGTGRRAASARSPAPARCGSASAPAASPTRRSRRGRCPRTRTRAGREHDALSALAHEMRSAGGEQWPQLLLLLGDQVYADEVPPRTAEWIAARRDTSVPPGEEVADFQEFCRLYEDSWSEPSVRWLLSTVPTAMSSTTTTCTTTGTRRTPGCATCAARDGGTSGSSAASWPTGSSSTWATWPGPCATRTRPTARCWRPRATRGRSCATSPSAPTATSPARAGATGARSGARAW